MFALFNALRGEKFSKKGAFIKVKLSTHIYTMYTTGCHTHISLIELKYHSDKVKQNVCLPTFTSP